MVGTENTTSLRRCPACNSADSVEAGEKYGYRLVSCCNCQTLYSATLPQLTNFYNTYYDRNSSSIPPAVIARIDQIVDGFSPYRSNNRFLDLGFGEGSYLSAASKAGWDVFGVEVSEGALERARKAGFTVFGGELSDANYPENYFDVVTAVEVLEHVANPGELMEEVVKILRPGGVFWATTPHGRALSYRLLGLKWTAVAPPEHLQLFSASGMRMMLANTGFDNINLQTHGFNPSEMASGLRAMVKDKQGPLPDVVLDADINNGFDRRFSACDINTTLMQSRPRRAIKRLVNAALNAVQQGDTLKILASVDI